MFSKLREPVWLAVWARVPGLITWNGVHAHAGGSHFDVHADAAVTDDDDVIEAALAEPVPGLLMSVVRYKDASGGLRRWGIASKVSFNEAAAILRAARPLTR